MNDASSPTVDLSASTEIATVVSLDGGSSSASPPRGPAGARQQPSGSGSTPQRGFEFRRGGHPGAGPGRQARQDDGLRPAGRQAGEPDGHPAARAPPRATPPA